MKEIYEQQDLIVSMLKFPNPCPVKVTITDSEVHLIIGPRDWQWDRKTGEMTGAGTMVA